METVDKALMAELSAKTGAAWREGVPLSRYTAARIGGAADFLIETNTAKQLEEVVKFIWEHRMPFYLLGSGSNVLVSDAGLRGVVIINRARGRGRYKFESRAKEAVVWVESGVNLGALARAVAEKGFSGLEWAAGVPGTVGGAVVNNAGAFDGDMQQCVVMVEILQRLEEENQVESTRQRWTVSELDYSYRSSRLKKEFGQAIVLSAWLKLKACPPEQVKQKMEQFNIRRRATQPPGASMGSMFKNPAGDYAGRLIEAAGLKGFQVGGVQISPLHANFFINHGQAKASEVWDLIQHTQQVVLERFGVKLEMEIQLLGDFSKDAQRASHLERG